MSWTEMSPALPEIALAVAIMAILMVGVFRKTDATGLVSGLCLAAMAGVAVLIVIADGGRMLAFGEMFVVDGFAKFAKILVLFAAAMALVMSLGFITREGMRRFEFPILMLFSVLGMLMMISANDFIALYVGLEMQSLALYVVASFRRDTLRSTEAGLKYFVLGALSSGMLLYGMSMVYGFAGTTSFEGLAAINFAGEAPPLGLIVGIVFVVAGLAFKVSAVPFHMWTPDVYEGAPTPVTAFFAVAPKIAAMALFVRVMMGPFGGFVEQWQQIIIFISIASMVLGALAAIGQTNIKRLMAYSSIGHMGYALVGLAAGTPDGVTAILVYLGIYLFMNVGTFAAILSMRRGERMVEEISDLSGLAGTNPVMAMMIAVLMFSLAGIPPLAGFFGKFFVFKAAVDAELFALAIIGVLASVIGAFYYLRIVKIMYFDEVGEPFDRGERVLSLTMASTSVLMVVFVVFMSQLITLAQEAAMALGGGA